MIDIKQIKNNYALRFDSLHQNISLDTPGHKIEPTKADTEESFDSDVNLKLAKIETISEDGQERLNSEAKDNIKDKDVSSDSSSDEDVLREYRIVEEQQAAADIEVVSQSVSGADIGKDDENVVTEVEHRNLRPILKKKSSFSNYACGESQTDISAVYNIRVTQLMKMDILSNDVQLEIFFVKNKLTIKNKRRCRDFIFMD